ncbi:transporter substrate-binding domain-containing protein [Aestuariirhabdus sp. LZHN29]|uniref:substrate-binding periplasmic protein n=1 Tax=Aestuariirhabdus sp. LZHN29 TaxID=3417462 RepID=UPI003CEABCA5
MPSFDLIRTASVALIALLLANTAHSQSNLPDRVTLSTAVIPPYQYTDENNQVAGIATDKVRCILGHMGIELEIELLPWARAQKRVQNGKGDGFYAASENALRNQYATLSAPILQGDWLWYQQPNAKLKTDSGLFRSNARVGTTFGTNMHSWLKGNGYQVTAHEKLSVLINMLEHGHLDAVLTRSNMFQAAEIPQSQKASYVSTVAQSKPLGVYFGHNFLARHPEFLPQFNTHIDVCRP